MELHHIALVGNPNSGKSSVFNLLTGLNQHVGNYPGVTVDKKTGHFSLENGQKIRLTDLPGTYSLYPRSEDERVVYDLLTQPNHPEFPELLIVVCDAANLERNLLLFSQLYDRKIPVILLLNMMDVAEKTGIEIHLSKFDQILPGVPVIPFNARKGTGLDQLKQTLVSYKAPVRFQPFVAELPDNLEAQTQVEDTQLRFLRIREKLKGIIVNKSSEKAQESKTLRFDRWAVHPISGYLIFLAILFVIFQAIYSLAEMPMDLIDSVFAEVSQWIKGSLPEGLLTDLLAEGIVPGLGGVVIFIPQIALLFVFIALMEESGYMSRVVFIMDRLMRPFGLSGKSVVPLISGVACAIPAIMATRTISAWKDRLITIMVTPLMSCAARLPVYTLLIALVIPDERIGGIFGLQGLVLFGMYLLGLLAALGAALIFRLIIRSERRSFLVLELPSYKMPRWKNIGITLWEKIKVFIWEAGRVILAISIVLWVMATFGPGDRMEEAVSRVPVVESADSAAMELYERQVQSVRLENSFIGILGKGIEPVIAPLGYDWKIGIALITSFAAREVFVGSMATIYSVGEDFETDESLLQRMRAEKHSIRQNKVYDLPTGLSLMVFYAFAMQCMSTLAIVYRETKSWKWPLIQTLYMTALAYIAAWLTYQIFV